MTKEQWRTKRTLPYIGCTLANNTFTWDSVECIGEIYIIELRAVFRVHFNSGEYIEYDYPNYDLEPDYIEVKALFGLPKKVKIESPQHYFDRNCDKLKELQAIRKRAVKALFEYKQGVHKLKGHINETT